MNPVSPGTVARRPARTGIGWLLHCLVPSSQNSRKPEFIFPAPEGHSTAETFAAALLIGFWSLAASLHLCLHSTLLPDSITLRALIGFMLWFALPHVTVILPCLAYPILRFFRVTIDRLAQIVQFTFLLGLSFVAWHLTASDIPLARPLGLFWMLLIMAEIVLRLAVQGIALASRPH